MPHLLNPRIAIVGAGAIGSLVGGILARNGKDVTLIGRKAHVDAIQRDGLKIDGVAGEFKVALRATESLDFSPDMLFIAVKTQDVEQTCRSLAPHIGKIPVIMMQNGVVSAEIAGAIFGKERIVSCIALLNAQFRTAGAVTYVNENAFVLGDAFTPNETRIHQIQALLQTVARTCVSHNINGAQWSKLVVNALGNPLDGMTGVPLGEYIQEPVVRRVGILILKEALHLVDRAGIHLESLPGIPVGAFKLMAALPLPLATWVLKYAMTLKGDPAIITSTLQSLRKGKPTEIDFLNGEFVRLGTRIGMPTPVNSKVVDAIHAIEESGVFYSPSEVARMFHRIC